MTTNTKVQAFKKNLIIETAQALFCGNPYEAVTVDDVAKAAGFGKSTVYSFFESKEEILETVLMTGLERLSGEFQKISEEEPDVKLALKLLIALQYEFFLKFGGLLFTYAQKCKTGAVKWDGQPGIKDMVFQKTSYLSILMQRGIQEGVFIPADPEYLAWIVTSMIKGVCMPSLWLKPGGRDQAKDIEILQQVILTGILSSE